MFDNFAYISIKEHFNRAFVFICNFFNKCRTTNNELCNNNDCNNYSVQSGLSFDNDNNVLGEICRTEHKITHCYRDTIYTQGIGTAIVHWARHLASELKNCLFTTNSRSINPTNPTTSSAKQCSFNYQEFVDGIVIACGIILGLYAIKLCIKKLSKRAINNIGTNDNIYSAAPSKNTLEKKEAVYEDIDPLIKVEICQAITHSAQK
ncbi:hypothetical protein K6025_05320 [Ehrlichia sp. JZT12]